MTDQSDPNARGHAKLSASQSKRWMTCPGSVVAVDEMPENMRPRQSAYAALGTAAHSVVEACLKSEMVTCRPYLNYWVCPDGTIESAKRHPEAFQVDHDMASAVDVMLDTVYAERYRLGADAELRIEHHFDLSWVRPDMFGTNDACISQFLGELVVVDYKHGQGVPVEVKWKDKDGRWRPNSQLAYYALGAAKADDFTHEKVTIIVVQPRCPHEDGPVRSFTMTMAELLEFRDELAKAADVVEEARKDRAKNPDWCKKWLVPGGHCKSTFCPKIATCEAIHDMVQREAAMDFDDLPQDLEVPTELEKMARALEWIPKIDAWARATEALAQRLAEQGTKVPQHKLVRKKANRMYAKPEDEVKAALIAAGVPEKDIMTEPELKSPAQVEKVGKKAKELIQGKKGKVEGTWEVEPLAIKGVGGITLAHESDPRAEVTPDIASDFLDAPEDVSGEGDA